MLHAVRLCVVSLFLGLIGQGFDQGKVLGEGITFSDPSSFGQRTYRPQERSQNILLRWNGSTTSWQGRSSLRGLEEASGRPFLMLSSESDFSDLDQTLKSFIVQNSKTLGVDAGTVAEDFQISKERSRFSGVYKYLTYNRVIDLGGRRLPVDSVYITFRFKNDRLLSISTSGLKISEEALTINIEADDAIQIVMEDSEFRKTEDAFQGRIQLSVKWIKNQEGQLVAEPIYFIEMKKSSRPGLFRYEVSADTGEILEISSNLHMGTAQGDFFERLPGQSTRKGLANVTVKSGDAKEFTDSEGGFSLEGPELLLELQNSSVRVMNASGKVTSLKSRGSSDLVFEAPDYLADVMAFVHVGRVAAFVKNRLRSIPMADGRGDFLANPITVNTLGKGPIKTCNAWYSPFERTLNFLPGDEECTHSAYISDIIYHEWGHALDDAIGGIKDRAFSEGIGDILSLLMTGDPHLAPGFVKGKEEGLRNLEVIKVFPRDRHKNPHYEGLIIGGAWYEVMRLMQSKYGANDGRSKTADIFLKHMLSAESYLESYQAALVVDDNDNNLSNGTPHYCFFNQAFSRRGLVEADNKCRDIVEDASQSLGMQLRKVGHKT